MLLFLVVLRGPPQGRLRYANSAFSFYYSSSLGFCWLKAHYLFQIMASGTDEALKSTGLVLAGNKHVYEIFSVEFLLLGCSDMVLTLWLILGWFYVQHWVRSYMLSKEAVGLEGTFWLEFVNICLHTHASLHMQN